MIAVLFFLSLEEVVVGEHECGVHHVGEGLDVGEDLTEPVVAVVVLVNIGGLLENPGGELGGDGNVGENPLEEVEVTAEGVLGGEEHGSEEEDVVDGLGDGGEAGEDVGEVMELVLDVNSNC